MILIYCTCMISAICNFKDKPFQKMRKYHLCKVVAIFADFILSCDSC